MRVFYLRNGIGYISATFMHVLYEVAQTRAYPIWVSPSFKCVEWGNLVFFDIFIGMRSLRMINEFSYWDSPLFKSIKRWNFGLFDIFYSYAHPENDKWIQQHVINLLIWYHANANNHRKLTSHITHENISPANNLCCMNGSIKHL